MAETQARPESGERVTISLPKTELETLTRLVENLRFIEETEKIKEKHDDEDYVSLSEVK